MPKPIARRRRLALTMLAALVVAVAVDRISLYLWQREVIGMYRGIAAAIAENRAIPDGGSSGFVAFGSEAFLVMPKDNQWPGRYVTVRTDRLLLNVASVTVDGAGDLHLRFFPPLLAWSTRLFPRADVHHGDPTREDPRYHYQFKLDVSVSTPGQEKATLQRGEYHFTPPLSGSELRPRWFY